MYVGFSDQVLCIAQRHGLISTLELASIAHSGIVQHNGSVNIYVNTRHRLEMSQDSLVEAMN